MVSAGLGGDSRCTSVPRKDSPATLQALGKPLLLRPVQHLHVLAAVDLLPPWARDAEAYRPWL
jgi:uncharacterized protein (DUF2236 family)